MASFDETDWKAGADRLSEADDALARGDLAAAHELVQAAERVLLEVVGPSHPDLAAVRVTQGMLAGAAGDPRQAIARFREALAVYDRHRDDPGDAALVRPLRAQVLGLLGHQYTLAGAYDEAAIAVREALAEIEREHGPRSEQAAAAWITLGVCARFRGNYDEAESHYRRAAELRRELGLGSDPTHEHNLAGLACARGEFARAELHAREAIRLRHALRGATTPDAAFELGTDLAGLADALTGLGRTEEAEAAYREALALYRRAGRDAHPEVAYALHNLADLLAMCGRAAESEAAYRESIGRKVAAFGAAHPEVAASLANLAVLLAEHDRHEDAASSLARALAIARDTLPAEHPIRAQIEALPTALSLDLDGRTAAPSSGVSGEARPDPRPTAGDDAMLVARAIAAIAGPATDTACRVRRARTLVLVVESGGLVMFNYLDHACEDCPRAALDILIAAHDWCEPARLVEGGAAAAEVERLIRLGFLVVAGTRAARDDQTYEERWEWDLRAGLFNLAIKDPPFMTTEEQVDDLEQRVDARPPIPLYTTNEGLETVLRLAPPELDRGVFPTLRRRRTYRVFTADPVPQAALRDCLFAGLGITELMPEPIAGMGALPLKMTPSGGARNPLEAYVHVGNVEGIPPGFYHYSAIDGTLGLVAAAPLPSPSELTCGQDWWDGAGAVIFLVADFARTMWKYAHPMAYRAVLIEAGHVGQNVMLAATHHGLTCGPTALLRDALLEQLLGLDRIMQSVVYALNLGVPTEERVVNPPSAEARIRRGAG